MRSVMCRRCFTEPGWNAHEPSEIGIDDFQSNRSLDETYRTAFLRGLFAHMTRGFYHDGRSATLVDVVNHYNIFKKLNLTEAEKTVFQFAHGDTSRLIQAAAVGIATGVLLAAWGLFFKLNKSAEELEPEAMAEAKKEDRKVH